MNPPVEVKVPFENVNDPTAKIIAWKVASGTLVKAGDVVVELENSKATFPVTAPVDGFVQHSRPEGEELPTGEVLFRISAEAAVLVSQQIHQTSNTTAVPTHAKPEAALAVNASAPIFSQRAQELINQLGLNPAAFSGLPFVKESDVRKIAREMAPASAPNLPTTPASNGAPLSSSVEKIPLERAKVVENRELLVAEREALRSTLFCFCPASGLQEACSRQTRPISRLAVLLFETASLLKRHPRLNAYYDSESIVVYNEVNLGFAVDMGRGLKVLVIRSASELSFVEISAKVEDLLVKYNTDTLSVLDVTGSTFTVTDLGAEGIFAFSPLLNSRQAAILGIGAELTNGPTGSLGFVLSCSFDHRILGGKQVAEFLNQLSARVAAHAASLQEKIAADDPLHCSRCFQTAKDLRSRRAFLLKSVEPSGYICSNCLSGY